MQDLLQCLLFQVYVDHRDLHGLTRSFPTRRSSELLAIAIALLVASGQVDQYAADGRAFLGGLCLDGRLRPVPGTICLTEALGDGALVLPHESADEEIGRAHV